MQNSRLCKLLTKLDSKDIKELNKIVRSPYFNNNPKCIELLALLLPFQKDGFIAPSLTQDYVFHQLFPNKKKVTRTLNTTMSDLIELINELRIQQKLKQKQMMRQHFLLESLLESGERKYFKTVYDKTMIRFNNRKFKNSDAFLEKYLLGMNYLAYLVQENLFHSGQYLADVIHDLDLFYMGQKLHLTCGLYSLKKLKPEGYDPVLVSNICQLAKKEQYSESSLIQLYSRAFLMISEPEVEQHFEEFLELFWGPSTDSLGKRELEDLFKIANNYCINKILMGVQKYTQKMFDLYEIMFASKLMFTGKYIHQLHLKNMIILSCKLKKIDRAFELNETYSKDIHPQYRANSYLTNLAIIHLHNKDYQSAMTYLSEIKETDAFHAMQNRSMLMKCYYELSESKAFYALCTSYRAFIRNNRKKEPQRGLAFENFTKLCRQLYRIKEGFSKKAPGELEVRIKGTSPIAEGRWLLEKCGEL